MWAATSAELGRTGIRFGFTFASAHRSFDTFHGLTDVRGMDFGQLLTIDKGTYQVYPGLDTATITDQFSPSEMTIGNMMQF